MRSAHGFSISTGNIKMGAVPSFSVEAGVTCPPDVPCRARCYAERMKNYRRAATDSYAENTQLLVAGRYDDLVEDVANFVRFSGTTLFRWNVSGDLFSVEYLHAIARVAVECPSTRFWVFTKQFGILEKYISLAEIPGCPYTIPANLNIVLSVWGTFRPPESLLKRFGTCHVQDKGGLFTIPGDAFVCRGDCFTCRRCAHVKAGESVVIHEH